ncbi:MAG TPA: energy transducer TonB [Sphingomonas sp.]|uniref:energy transducer TonB n=1 Tax=Sphingomonas sp. TaxID=28214 RepID=UPI002EDB86E5
MVLFSGRALASIAGWWTTSLAVAALAMSVPASARDWPRTAGWDIAEGDEYCALTSEFEGKGDTELSVAKYLDGHALVVVTNFQWSAKKDQEYDLTFVMGDESFGGGASIGLGESSGRKGFASRFPADFIPAFAAASGFKIYMGETLVDSLNLSGSAAALQTVERCLAAKRSVKAAAERERRRFSHIADDPFAGVRVEPRSAKVRGDLALMFGAENYPPAAMRAGAQGRVAVELEIGADGRVSGCTVASSSGSADLDQTTCRIFRSRVRFDPATDDKGEPTTGRASHAVTWKMPEPEAPPLLPAG